MKQSPSERQLKAMYKKLNSHCLVHMPSLELKSDNSFNSLHNENVCPLRSVTEKLVSLFIPHVTLGSALPRFTVMIPPIPI